MATTQNISMTDELVKFVSEQVESGEFSSASEVYREALRRFRDRVEAQKRYKDLVLGKIETSKQAYQKGDYVSLDTVGVDDLMTSITDEINAEYA